MGRLLLMLFVLLLLAAGLAATLYPWIDCLDCPYEGLCLRCKDRRKISILESRRRAPLDPDLATLMQARGVTAPNAGNLAVKHGKARRDALGWKDEADFFYYATATQVEGPGGPLVLARLEPKTYGANEGNPARIILYDRTGGELDRIDFSSPGFSDGPFSRLELFGIPSVLVSANQHSPAENGPVRFVRGAQVTILEIKDWPQDYLSRGIARIVARDGRLEIVAP